jgi:hypothetical protein
LAKDLIAKFVGNELDRFQSQLGELFGRPTSSSGRMRKWDPLTIPLDPGRDGASFWTPRRLRDDQPASFAKEWCGTFGYHCGCTE